MLLWSLLLKRRIVIRRYVIIAFNGLDFQRIDFTGKFWLYSISFLGHIVRVGWAALLLWWFLIEHVTFLFLIRVLGAGWERFFSTDFGSHCGPTLQLVIILLMYTRRCTTVLKSVIERLWGAQRPKAHRTYLRTACVFDNQVVLVDQILQRHSRRGALR